MNQLLYLAPLAAGPTTRMFTSQPQWHDDTGMMIHASGSWHKLPDTSGGETFNLNFHQCQWLSNSSVPDSAATAVAVCTGGSRRCQQGQGQSCQPLVVEPSTTRIALFVSMYLCIAKSNTPHVGMPTNHSHLLGSGYQCQYQCSGGWQRHCNKQRLRRSNTRDDVTGDGKWVKGNGATQEEGTSSV